MTDKQPEHFDSVMTELEQLLAKMEKGELSLEESLAAFEKGVKLASEAQKTLNEAQLKVDMLVNENEELLQPFSIDEDDDDL